MSTVFELIPKTLVKKFICYKYEETEGDEMDGPKFLQHMLKIGKNRFDGFHRWTGRVYSITEIYMMLQFLEEHDKMDELDHVKFDEALIVNYTASIILAYILKDELPGLNDDEDDEDDEDDDDDDEEDASVIYGFIQTDQHDDVYIATKGDHKNGLFIFGENEDCWIKIGKLKDDGSYKIGSKHQKYREFF